MRRRAKTAKRTRKKLGFTTLVLDIQRKPALFARYRKNPKLVAKRYGLTAAQAKALESGIVRRINAQIAAETGSFWRRWRPWFGTVHF